jgi:hypothetical protein
MLNKFKKFLFLFPLLTLTMWAIGAVPSIKIESISLKTKNLIKENSEQEFSHVITAEVLENDFVISELEPEFEVELDWYNSAYTTYINEFLTIETQPIFFYNFYFSSKSTIPLYDLFCNWKYHLS